MTGYGQRQVIELEHVPSLGAHYVTAVRTAAATLGRAGLSRIGVARERARPGDAVLPLIAYRVTGIQAEPGRLMRYQRLMGDTLRDGLPSVFVHGLSFPVAMSVMVSEDFPLPLMGLVHLSNRVEHRREIRVDETLTVTAWAEQLRPHFAGTQVDLVSEVADASGNVVWRGVSTYLAKGVNCGPGQRPERPELAAFVAPTRTARWRLSSDTGRQYAEVLGDWNPIHLTKVTARLLGLKRHMAHGMYSAGRALAAVAPHDGGYDWEIDFTAPVFLPATVDFAAEAGDGQTRFTGFALGATRPHFTGELRAR